jgi:hypothetical protein
MEKKTKSQKVKEHLMKFGHITSWEAIKSYRATRLAAIICNFRKQGMDIVSVPMAKKQDGENVNFVKYVYNKPKAKK